ncbi:MAG: STAS domain-containing protein [Actinomycetota bacterium]|nr:STAS domain-containing protein [Actinomycetota bacterium]
MSSQRPAEFRITTERHGRKMAWLALFGRLDLHAAGVLARELLNVEGRGRQVILDARGLSFLDATGVQVLLHASQRAKRGGWDFAVIQGSKPIARLLQFPDIARRLRLVNDPADLLS